MTDPSDSRQAGRKQRRRLGPWLGALLALGCILGRAAEPPLSGPEVRWLNRITYGIDARTVARYQALGRKRFLDEQLRGRQAEDAGLAAELRAMTIARIPPEQLLQEADAEGKRIQGLGTEEARQQARQAQNQMANQLVAEAARRHLLRALESPNQLREQMVWFWLNHFSVFQGKGNLRWLLADYEEQAIRPQALGRFRDLLLATMTHPAMLVYLDNAQSSAGRINENYARELLELHTLGVNGGYSQQDIQELARVLTGLGVHAGPDLPKLKPEWRPLYLRRGAFEFNPGRHDFGEKTVLGQRIPGEGFPEVERIADLLAAHPATARQVSRELAAYWLGEEPSGPLVERVARVFLKTGGDIPEVLRVVLESREFSASLGKTFKDPMHYVVFALRLAYDGKRPVNMKPVINWLSQLGEPLYGRVTPDGYPLAPSAWSSSGQLVKRFEIARAIGSGNAGLFDGDDGRPAVTTGFPQLASRLYFEAIEPALSLTTRQGLSQAGSQQEWNTFLLASPDLMMH
ncbi:MAG: DUF1800 domain-containing protein [Holophaga sp.]|nr:DUF1800 domain-containing protein [Holophaga sp.]